MRTMVLLFVLCAVLLPLSGQTQKGPGEEEIRFYESIIATRDEGLAVCRTLAQTVKANIELYASIDKKSAHPDDRAVTRAGGELVMEAFTLAKGVCDAFAILDDDRAADIAKKDFPRFKKEKMPTDTRSFRINVIKLGLMEVHDAVGWWNRNMVEMNEGMKKKPQALVIKELLTATLRDAPEMRKRLDAIKKKYPVLTEERP
ncbi:MAG TPA: hypothetical protein PKH10_01080 [bacterium]|nr:hypothetical protein [bacterium]